MSQVKASGQCSGELVFWSALYTPAQNRGIKGFPKMPTLSSEGRLHCQQLGCSPIAQPQPHTLSSRRPLSVQMSPRRSGESLLLQGQHYFTRCPEGSSWPPWKLHTWGN